VRGSRRRRTASRGDPPGGDPEPEPLGRPLRALLARQNEHIEDLGSTLDEAIETAEQLRAELDDERGRR
jgi:hypothetical protein